VGNLIGKGRDEESCCFHVDAEAAGPMKVIFELIIVFPHPAICRVHRPGVVVLLVSNDGAGNRLPKPKGGQGRNLSGIIAFGCTLGPDGSNWQNEVTHL